MLTAQPLPSERWEQTYYWTSCSLESCRRYPAWFQWNHLPSTFPKHVSSSISWACAEHSQDQVYSIHSRSNPSVDDTHLDHHCSLGSTWWAQGGDEEQTSTHQQSSLSRAWGHQFKASSCFRWAERSTLGNLHPSFLWGYLSWSEWNTAVSSACRTCLGSYELTTLPEHLVHLLSGLHPLLHCSNWDFDDVDVLKVH